jgi:hypothetical protein
MNTVSRKGFNLLAGAACFFLVQHIQCAAAQDHLFKRIPVSFEENRGQFEGDNTFRIHAREAQIGLKATELSIVRARPQSDKKSSSGRLADVSLSFVNANKKAEVKPGEPSGRKSYYFLGSDTAGNSQLSGLQVIEAKHYRSVRVSNLYPGIDAVYYGVNGEVEYDLVVQPGVDPSAVRIRFSGASSTIDAAGNLRLDSDVGTVLHRKPLVYQGEAVEKRPVASRYIKNQDGTFGIAIGSHDSKKPLVIDPVISFASYLGGSIEEAARDIAFDNAGRVLIAGSTSSFDFPVRGGLQLATPSQAADDFTLGYVTRFNKAGTDIEFSTFIGIQLADRVRVDNAGNIYLAGVADTKTGAIPSQLNAYRATGTIGYLAKLSPNGDTLLGATYIGEGVRIRDMAVNGVGSVAVAGWVEPGGTLTPTASAWRSVASTGFVAKFSSSLSTADFVTYAPEEPKAVAIDTDGNVFIAGGTASTSYPVTAGAYQAVKKDSRDAFVTKLSPAGAMLLSTYLGANKSNLCFSGDDWATGLAIAADGSVYVAGQTMSSIDNEAGNPFTGSRHYQWNGVSAFLGNTYITEDARAFLVKLAPTFASVQFGGSIATSTYARIPTNASSQPECYSAFANKSARVFVDSKQNAVLLASALGNRFPVVDRIHSEGDSVLIVNASGERIAATKLTATGTYEKVYAVNRSDGAIAFASGSSASNTGLQPTAGSLTPTSDAVEVLVTRIGSPLTRITLGTPASSTASGQSVALTASIDYAAIGGVLTLKQNGIEISRTTLSGATTSLAAPNLAPGLYTFVASYVIPDGGGTIVSRPLFHTVNGVECP